MEALADALDDRQAQPVAGALRGGVASEVALENPRKLRLLEPRAGVLDRQAAIPQDNDM